MYRLILSFLLCVSLAPNSFAVDLVVRVVDDDGSSVDNFEAMWHTADHGYSSWKRQQGGIWKDSFALDFSGNVLDLVVRADGFASRVQRFEGESHQALRDGKATIVLERGMEVTIEAQGLPSAIPQDFLMDSFFPDFAWRVRMMWQPANLREKKKADWNMLNVRRVDDSHFAVRLSEGTGEFCLAFQHPGWLQFCELGQFTSKDVVDNKLSLRVPNPGKIEVTFDSQKAGQDQPFESAHCSVYWSPDDSGSYYSVADGKFALGEKAKVELADLGPGRYMVDVRTTPNDETAPASPTAINPGLFMDRAYLALAAGESKELNFVWVPFDPHAYQGSASAEIKVARGDGSIPVGSTINVTWYDGHYGVLEVYKGPLPETGTIRLKDVSFRRNSEVPFGPFAITIDGEQLGFFHLEETDKVQPLEFTVSPKVGDFAPNIELRDVGSSKRRQLSDFRGRVVLIEFWSTGCGPCQPAMENLSKLAANLPASWADNVALLSLSTDHDLGKLRAHIAARGWKGLPHFQAARKAGEHFSDAEKSYVVYAIPEAILIDQQGFVRWRGHPIIPTEGKSVEDRINELLK